MQRVRQFITTNWFAKLFAIALSALLWITISSERNSEIGVSIPLEYLNIPSQLEVIGDTTNTVEVRLRGPARLIREVSAGDVSATVDLANVQPGEKIVQLTSQNVRSPFGIAIVRVSPSQIRLNLDRTMEKALAVVARVSGEPARGFEVLKTEVLPVTVQVEGPESKVKQMESVLTAVVRLDGRSASFRDSVDLDLQDPMVRLRHQSQVEVRISIGERGLK